MRQDGSQFGRRLLVCICIAARRPPTPCPVAGVRRLFRTSFLVCHGIPSVYPVLNKNSENKGSVFLFRGTPRRYTLRILSSFCFRLGVKMRKRSDIQRPFRRPASNRGAISVWHLLYIYIYRERERWLYIHILIYKPMHSRI